MNQEAPLRKLYVAIIGAGPVGLVCAAKLAFALGPEVNIEIYERRITWNPSLGLYEWISEDQGNRRREQVVTLQDDVVNLLTHDEVRHLFDGERVWRTSRNVAIRDLEDRLLDFCQKQLSCHSNIRFSQLPGILVDDHGRVDTDRFADWVKGLDVDMVIGADGADSMTRSSFGIPHVPLGRSDERLLKQTDYALGIGLTAEGVDGGQRQPLNAALTLAQNRYLLNSEQGKRGYLNIRLTPDEYNIIAEHNDQGTCGFGNPISLYNLYREPEAEGALPLVDGVPKIDEIISEGLNLYNLSWRHVNSVVGIQITPTYAERFYHLDMNNANRPKHVFLVGDAAMSHHFWPGRGLNTGLKSAVAATEVIDRFARTNQVEYLHRFELFMVLLRFREMQGRSASMLRKDNSLPRWLDELENLPANHKPAQGSLTRVLLDQTSHYADVLREQFLTNVMAWNEFNENSTGWPHEVGSVTGEMIRHLIYTSQSRPKLLTLRTMVESAVPNNARRAGWPIHQQRGFGEFEQDMSPQGWWVGSQDVSGKGDTLNDVESSVLQLIRELVARGIPQTEMVKTRLQKCNIELSFDESSNLSYDLLMREGMGLVRRADYSLPTVLVLGHTGVGKSTSIAHMRGDPLVSKYEESGDGTCHYLVPGAGYAGPEIGATGASTTCFPVSYPITTPHGMINVCDTAGFFESRSALYEAVGVGLVQYVLGAVEKPTGFVIVCEFADFDMARVWRLCHTFDLFGEIFPDKEDSDEEKGRPCKPLPAPDANVVLLVTKTTPGYKPDLLRSKIQGLINELDQATRKEAKDRRCQRNLKLFLDHGSLATYGTDNVMHFMHRDQLDKQSNDDVKDILDVLGSWKPFNQSRLGNLSKLGANARNFLGSMVLRERAKMIDATARARELIQKWQTLRSRKNTSELLCDGLLKEKSRQGHLQALEERLTNLSREQEVVVWEHTEQWTRGVRDNERVVAFQEEGMKISNVIEDVSSHVCRIRGGISEDRSVYRATFRRKNMATGHCKIKVMSLYCDLPFVARTREEVKAMLKLLLDKEGSWKVQKEFLQKQLGQSQCLETEIAELIVQLDYARSGKS